MNLPNKLTILRVAMIPFFVLFMLVDIFGEADKYIAVIIFMVASLTDLLDGQIARKYNLVTNFGKFMDPLADKLLVGAALICMADSPIPKWIIIIIISREFIISGFRLVAADKGVVIAAGWWGKLKTVSQMIMIIVLIFDFNSAIMNTIEWVLIYASLILTVVSLLDYLVKNKDVMKDEKSA